MKQPTGARGAIILLLVLAVTSVLGYVFNVVLAWLLPASDYGIYGVALAISGILCIFIIYAFPWSVVKFLSAEKEQEKRVSVFKTALLANFLTALVISGLFYCIYFFLFSSSDIPLPVIFVLISIVLIFSIRSIYLRTLHGLMRFEQMGAVSVVEVVVSVAAGLGLVYLGYGVAGALAGELIGGIVVMIIALYLLRDFKFWQGKDWANVKVLSFAWPMFLGMVGITLLSKIDILGLKYLSQGLIPSQSVGHYQAVRVLAMIPLFLAGGIMGGVFPFISRHHEEGGLGYLVSSLRYVVLLLLPVAVVLVLLPASIIGLFFPHDYVASANALRVLAVGGACLAVIQVLTSGFQALGQPGIPVRALMLATGVQIASLVVLVPRFGLVGAAASTAIACLSAMVWLLSRLANIYQLKPKNSQIAKLILALAVTGLFLSFFPHSSRILTVLDCVLAGIIYLSLLIVLRLVREDDVDILRNALPHNRLVEAVTNGVKKVIVKFNKVS